MTYIYTSIYIDNNSNATLTNANDLNDNIPHIQNLQNLILLTQSNPELLNQLTNDVFYNSPTTQQQQQQATSPISSSVTTPASSSTVLPDQSHSLHNITNSISNIANSADTLNQDIDDLGISLQTLAQHLGFDPTKMNNSVDDPVKIEDEGDLLDMDEFLNTFGKLYSS